MGDVETINDIPKMNKQREIRIRVTTSVRTDVFEFTVDEQQPQVDTVRKAYERLATFLDEAREAVRRRMQI